jgi:hypothetical protein
MELLYTATIYFTRGPSITLEHTDPRGPNLKRGPGSIFVWLKDGSFREYPWHKIEYISWLPEKEPESPEELEAATRATE